MLLHIPHSSRRIPDLVRKGLLPDDATLTSEILFMTDWFTDELYALEDYKIPRVIYPYSRIVCDVERFSEDTLEPMSSRGMGAIYERLSDGRILREPMRGDARNAYLELYYYPHHRQLEKVADSILIERNRCLIIDCHSFPSVPLFCDLDQTTIRPDICIGTTDSMHTPHSLVRFAEDYFRQIGFDYAINRPYSGSIVPRKHFLVNPRVKSLMIEIRRGLYIDEGSHQKLAVFEDIRKVVHDLLFGMMSLWSDCKT